MTRRAAAQASDVLVSGGARPASMLLQRVRSRLRLCFRPQMQAHPVSHPGAQGWDVSTTVSRALECGAELEAEVCCLGLCQPVR